MKISLITVCYNPGVVLRTALESVLRQREVDVEYLVIDGGSTDGTIVLLKEYEKQFQGRMRWISERDRGMYDALNKGIDMAQGDVIGILNSDDVLSSDDMLSMVAGAFKGGVDVDAVYADIRFVRSSEGEESLESLRGQETLRHYSAKHWRPWMLQWGFMPPHPGVYIRKECFAKLGNYKLGYKIAADYELLVRFLRRGGLRTKYLNRIVVDMRMGGMSTNGWRSNLLLNRENVRANRENGYMCFLVMMVPKYAFKIWEFIVPMIRRKVCRNK